MEERRNQTSEEHTSEFEKLLLKIEENNPAESNIFSIKLDLEIESNEDIKDEKEPCQDPDTLHETLFRNKHKGEINSKGDERIYFISKHHNL